MPQLTPSVRTTYNVELTSQPDRTGRSSVMIRLHQKGERPGRVLTRVKIEKRYWNPKKNWGRWIIRHVDSAALNADILSEYNRVRDQAEAWLKALPAGQLLTPQQLAEQFRGEVSDRYFVWVDLIMEDVRQQSYSTFVCKRNVINAFKAWAGADLPISSVTVDLVRRYRDHLRSQPSSVTGEKLKASTVNKYVARLSWLHEQILIRTGTPRRQAPLLSPWAELETLKETRTRKVKLSSPTIDQLATVSVTTRRRRITPDGAFRLWMLAHFLAGIRISDLLLLRYANFTLNADGQPVHLRYEMIKTGFVINIPLVEPARELLASFWQSGAQPQAFLLPYLDSRAPHAQLVTYEQYRSASFALKKARYNALVHWNRQISLCLAEVEKEAGLTDKLRMHNARHSFADLARRIMAEFKTITLYDIQLMMGHSTPKQTSDYMEQLSGQDATQPLTAVFSKKT